MNDVAYFIGAGLEPQVRKPVEEELVRGYHDGLSRAGVSDYSWEDCWLGYRRGAFAGFAVTVIASMLVQRTDRGDTMFTTMASAAMRDTPLTLGRRSFCASDNCLLSEYRPTPCVPLDLDPLPVCFHHRTSSLPGLSDRILASRVHLS